MKIIVLELDIERLLYLSTNRDDSHRDRYREVVLYINQ